MKKHMLKETNDMRRLMGLNLIKEEEEVMEMDDIMEMDDMEEQEEDTIKEEESKLPTMDEMKKCISEGMSKEQICEKYSECNEEEINEMYDSCKKMEKGDDKEEERTEKMREEEEIGESLEERIKMST